MNILFLGGDKRYEYMINELSHKHTVSYIGFDISGTNIYKEDISSINLYNFDIVLFPITGINDKMEIKTLQGNIALSKDLFYNLNKDTLFFTGLKTDTLLQLVPTSQVISFLDDEDVKNVNDELTVQGTIDNIKDRKNDCICILGYGKLGKELYWRLSDSRH